MPHDFKVLAVVTYESDKVVPRQKRAAWLKKWGVPPPQVRFIARASPELWEAAGCQLEIDSSGVRVGKISDVVRDVLCWEARAAVEKTYDKTGTNIPDGRTEGALQRAAEILTDRKAQQEREKVSGEQAKEAAARFAAYSRDHSLVCAADAGYDVRAHAAAYVIGQFIQHCGVDPIIRSTKNEFTERNSPSALALAIYYELEASVYCFEWPSFISAHVDRVSRVHMEDGRFLTVVPITFTVPGLHPIRYAWNADSREA